MATHYGADAQRLLNAQTVGKHNSYRIASDLIVVKESYTLKGTETVNDVILLGRDLPAGRVIIPALSTILCQSSPGTTFTLSIGASGVEGNIATSLPLAGAGVKQPLGSEFEILAATSIKATVKAASALSASAVIDFYFVCRQTS